MVKLYSGGVGPGGGEGQPALKEQLAAGLQGGGEADDDLLDWCEKLDIDDYHDNWLSLACSGGSDLATGLPELAAMEDFEDPA